MSDLERGLRTVPRRETVDLLADALALDDVQRDQLAAAVPRRKGPMAPAIATNLPLDPNQLIGREQEEARAVHLFRWDGVRLLTLTGPGGVGKTRLAVQVARALSRDYAGGQVFVPLASLADRSLVPSTLGAALDIRAQGGRRTEEVLISHLIKQERLLLLDNFEHLMGAEVFLARLIDTCPGLRILVTSRTPLNVRGEQAMDVPPLSVPAPSSRLSPTEAARSPAVALFQQRARAVRPDFRLSEDNAVTVAEICYRLDGLPLAVELAAARVKLFPPRTLLQRLARPLPLLTGGPAEQPHRQRTMRDTIDWSYSLLSPDEQSLFTRLGVFTGGCTFDAVEAVCDPEGELDLLMALASLVDQNLVRQDGHEQERFTMLETIREYALEKLEARGEGDRTRAAHASYFVQLAERAEPEINGPDQAQWFARLELELNNLRAAVSELLHTDRIDDELRMVSALVDLWLTRGTWSEAVGWLQTGLSSAGEISDRTRASALARQGMLAMTRGDLDDGTKRLTEGLALAREIGDAAESAWALNYLGWCLYIAGDVIEGTRRLEEGLRLYRDLNDRLGTAIVLTSLAAFDVEGGDFVRSEARNREALALFRAVGARGRVAFSLYNLGAALRGQGKYVEARACLDESLVAMQELKMKGVMHGVLDELGYVSLRQGELEQAAKLFSEGLTTSWDMEDPRMTVSIVSHIAEMAVERGQFEAAARLAGAVGAAWEAAGMPMSPVELETRDSAIARLREYLGDEKFRHAWERGCLMDLEHAVALALELCA